MIEIFIPIEDLCKRGFDDPRKAEYMAAAIRSMVGEQPTCLFFSGELRVHFTEEQFNRMKKWYGRKLRSNITHEIKRHCAINGYRPILRKLTISKL